MKILDQGSVKNQNNMTNKHFLLMALGLGMSVSLNAQRGSCGTGVSWSLNNGTLTISGDGDMTDFSSPQYPNNRPSWHIYKDEITRVVTESGVRHIGDNAFNQYGNLREVVFAEGLRSIGSSTFSGCTGLKEVEIPSTVEIIGGKHATDDSRSMPESRALEHDKVSMGSGAFSGCTGLTEVTIPATVWAVGSKSFENCSSLRSVNWNIANHHPQDMPGHSAVSYTSNYSPFYRCPIERVTFGSEVDTIPGGLFDGNSLLGEIRFSGRTEYVGKDALRGTQWYNEQPDGMVYIDRAAYSYAGMMTRPTAVAFAEGTVSITDGCLAGHTYLTKVSIPQSVRYIGQNAFDGCQSLGEAEWNAVDCDARMVFASTPLFAVTFGNGVQRIPDYLCYNCSYLTEVNLPSSVTYIGEYAFNGCSALTDINFSENLDSIGNSALANCTSLSTLRLPGKLRTINSCAFENCSSLAELELPASLETIGSNAFTNHKLRELTIPENVKRIGDVAFYAFSNNTETLHKLVYNAIECVIGSSASSLPAFTPSLLELEIGDKVKALPYNLCKSQSRITTVKIGKSLQSLPANCFRSCRQLTSVEWNAINIESCSNPFSTSVETFTFGNEVERIPGNVCKDLANLKSVAIPQSVTSIGQEAFAGSGITSITIPDNVTDMGNRAFEDCEALAEAILGTGLATIPNSTFRGCTALASLTIPSSVTQIGSLAMSSTGLASIDIPNAVAAIGDKAFSDCTNLSSATFGEGLKTMGEDVFDNCGRLTEIQWNATGFTGMCLLPATLTKVNFGDKVENIPSNICASCTQLTAINLPESVKAIGDFAFYECTGLQSISLPGNIEEIGRYAFQRCTNIKDIKIPATLTKLGAGAFYECGLTSLFVPSRLTDIGSQAFAYNRQLAQAIVSPEPFRVADDIFYGCDALAAIYLPDVREYKKCGGWSSYSQQLKDMVVFGSDEYTYEGKAVTPACTVCMPDYEIKGMTHNDTLPMSVGRYEVPLTMEFEGPDNFTATVTHRFRINPRNLTISAEDATRQYGDDNPEFKLSYDGFAANEDASALDEIPAIYCSADKWSDVGEYTIWLEGGKAKNYEISLNYGTLSITQAGQQITWQQKLDTLTVGDKVALVATASSGLNVEYHVDNEGAAKIEWAEGRPVLSCLAEGEITVTAMQRGDMNFLEAEPVSKTITVSTTSGIGNVRHDVNVGKAYAGSNKIIVDGIAAGAAVRVYSTDGKLLHYTESEGSKVEIPIKGHGLYIVSWNETSVKLTIK